MASLVVVVGHCLLPHWPVCKGSLASAKAAVSGPQSGPAGKPTAEWPGATRRLHRCMSPDRTHSPAGELRTAEWALLPASAACKSPQVAWPTAVLPDKSLFNVLAAVTALMPQPLQLCQTLKV